MSKGAMKMIQMIKKYVGGGVKDILINNEPLHNKKMSTFIRWTDV